jgi:protein-disulfide isomerase
MKLFFAILLVLLSFSVFAQKIDEVLATANSQNFTTKDLAPELREAFVNLSKTMAEMRKTLLEQQIADILIEAESVARKIPKQKLVAAEITAKISDPTDAQIKAVYEANRESIGGKTLAEVRPQIIAFLKREPEQKAQSNYISSLKTRYKITIGKDVNAPHLKATEILATANGKQITVKDFEDKNKLTLFELEAETYDQVKQSIEQNVFSSLIAAEAKSQNIETSDLIAHEVTDKMHEFSAEEREQLQTAFQKRLFQKYNPKILLKELEPIAQNISTDDDPAQGKQNAPVTIVMFTDFQCPACAAVHPVLKNILAQYSDKVRLVVRDFPLTQIHENAFQAALAANAANAQGKFFEYAELLYQNQDKLDAASLKRYASDAGLNQKQFESELGSERFAAEVRKDMADGRNYGINGTPTIFVGGVKVRQMSVENLRNAIEKALRK